MSDWLTKTINSENLNFIDVENLDENTLYMIRIQAISNDGPGIISDNYEVAVGQKRILFYINLIF